MYLARHPNQAPHVRFFGGEPLLRFPLLLRLVESFPCGERKRRASFSFPTNGTLITRRVLDFLRRNPHVEAAVSRVRKPRALARLPNVVVNLCVPPGGAEDLPAYTARLLAGGMRHFNFLPAFFVAWKPAQLRILKRSLRLVAGLIRECSARGAPVEVRNRGARNPVPLFNHGMVVDVDGDVFPSNAVFCGPFTALRDRLRLGSVLDPKAIDWRRAEGIDWDRVFRDRLSGPVYRSTMQVNELLTEFVENLAPQENGHAPAPAA